MAIARMKDAMAVVMGRLPQEAALVCANGYISREAFNLDDRKAFYMIGSMGLGASIAFGAAHALPDRQVVIFDGDGNVLMGMGSLALVGAYSLTNLVHLCFDNGVYASTGNQPALSPKVAFEGVAAASGYRHAARVDTLEELEAEVEQLYTREGPVFLRVMVEPEGHPRTFDRVSHTPVEIRDRFSQALQGE